MPTRIYQFAPPASLLHITTDYLSDSTGFLLVELPFTVEFRRGTTAYTMSRERLAKKLEHYNVSEENAEALKHVVAMLRNEAEQQQML